MLFRWLVRRRLDRCLGCSRVFTVRTVRSRRSFTTTDEENTTVLSSSVDTGSTNDDGSIAVVPSEPEWPVYSRKIQNVIHSPWKAGQKKAGVDMGASNILNYIQQELTVSHLHSRGIFDVPIVSDFSVTDFDVFESEVSKPTEYDDLEEEEDSGSFDEEDKAESDKEVLSSSESKSLVSKLTGASPDFFALGFNLLEKEEGSHVHPVHHTSISSNTDKDGKRLSDYHMEEHSYKSRRREFQQKNVIGLGQSISLKHQVVLPKSKEKRKSEENSDDMDSMLPFPEFISINKDVVELEVLGSQLAKEESSKEEKDRLVLETQRILTAQSEYHFNIFQAVAHIPPNENVLTVGGDHSIAIGSVLGNIFRFRSHFCEQFGIKAKQQQPRMAVVWVDAHADINTLKNSPSKNTHGMPVAFFTGLERCFPWVNDIVSPAPFPVSDKQREIRSADELQSLMGRIFSKNKEKIDEKNEVDDIGHYVLARGDETREHKIDCRLDFVDLYYWGIRDLDDYELELLSKYNMKEIPRFYNESEQLSYLRRELLDKYDAIHCSLDVDSIDPSQVPCTGTPVENGLDLDIVCEFLDELFMSEKCSSMDLVEYNPLLGDWNDRVTTLESVKKIIRILV